MSSALISICTAAALVTSGAAPVVPGPQPLPTLSMRADQPAPAPAPAPAEVAPTPAEAAPAEAATPAAAPAGDPAAATAPPAPAGDPAAATQPPPPTINVTVQAPPPTPPPPQPPEPDVTAGRGLLITGGVMMGVGGVSLLLVAMPSAIVRNVALDRAERDDVLAFSSKENRYNRARRADDAMEAGFWIGAPMLLAGTAILIVGSVIRNSARNRQTRRMRASVAPGGMAVRF